MATIGTRPKKTGKDRIIYLFPDVETVVRTLMLKAPRGSGIALFRTPRGMDLQTMTELLAEQQRLIQAQQRQIEAMMELIDRQEWTIKWQLKVVRTVTDCLRRDAAHRHDAIRRDIQAGIAELDRGDGEPLDMDAIKADVAENYKQSRAAA